MLISFSVENFKSIRDLQTLSMEADKSDRLEWSHVFEAGRHRLLRSAAIYGANASGKSNVIDATIWFRRFVLNSHRGRELGEAIGIDPFRLNTFSAKKPTHFEVEFFWKDIEYRYGFEVTNEKVESEWLFQRKQSSREAKLFTRENQEISISPTFFKEAKGLEKRTREDALFLTVCAQFNVKTVHGVFEWIDQFRNVSGLSDRGYQGFTAKQLQEKRIRRKITRFAQTADFHVKDISSTVEEIEGIDLSDVSEKLREAILADPPTATSIQTIRDVRNGKGEIVGELMFELNDEESEGTKKFIGLAGPILHTLEKGGILVVDEFEARLHPRLTQAIVDLFHSPANRKNAQLIIATHDVTLMDPDRFRKDQILFCEKGEDGATELYSLADFDSDRVRQTAKFSRQYLLGIFGAVPNLSHFEEAVAHATTEKK